MTQNDNQQKAQPVEPKLFSQSFQELRDRVIDSKKNTKITLVGIVTAEESKSYDYTSIQKEVTRRLKNAALQLRATHVFGVTYETASPGNSLHCLAYGDAYRIEEQGELP
jgi:uncharacterized protein YbjQ (UPF0145 family)